MKMISIIITTYNRFDYLKNALQSVQEQTYPNKEIIIVDDCSSDVRYEELYNLSSIHYFRNKINEGASESRKLGIKEAKGDYIIFLDDDDFYSDKNFFSKCVKVFENNSSLNLSFVCANADLYIDNLDKSIDGKKLDFNGFVDGNEYLSYFQYKYMKPYSTFTTMFKLETIQKFILGTSMFNDSSIYIKALLFGNAWFLNDIIGFYRIHSNNISKGLNINFVISNLNEKYHASREANFYIDTDEWLFQQYRLTCEYFMKESLPSLKNNLVLLRWNLNHLKKFKFKLLFFKCWGVNVLYEIRNLLHKKRKCYE